MDRVRMMMNRNNGFEESKEEEEEGNINSSAEYEDLLDLDDEVVPMPVSKDLFDSLPHAKFTQANA